MNGSVSLTIMLDGAPSSNVIELLLTHRMDGEGNKHLYIPLSYFKRGMRIRADTNVGIPMTRPENVSPPPNRLAYTFDDGTMMKKEI